MSMLMIFGVHNANARPKKALTLIQKQKKLKDIQKKVEKMSRKGWTFYAYQSKQIYVLTGKYRYTKVSFDEFYMPRLFQRYSKEYRPSQVGKDVVYFYQKGFTIVLRRNGRFFRMKDGKINEFDPLEESIFDINKEKAQTFKRAQCALCSFKLSFNTVSVGGNLQYNAEFAWLPYFSLTDYTGIRLSVGLSPYTVENDDLEEVVDPGFKGQILFRQYLYNLFFEIGGGVHYFMQSGDTSPMVTTGLGYTFIEPHWIFSEKIHMSNIFFHISTIDWDETINEAKFGVGLTF